MKRFINAMGICHSLGLGCFGPAEPIMWQSRAEKEINVSKVANARRLEVPVFYSLREMFCILPPLVE
jgi:hypothetical protein